MKTKTQNAPVLEKATQKFLDSLKGATPLYTLTPQQARKVLEDVQAHPTESIGILSEEKTISGPKGPLRLNIFRPKSAQKLPVVVYYHGGGWILGSMKTHENLVKKLALHGNAVVVFVNYTPSPEAQYPEPLEEAYTALTYVAENLNEFNADPERIIIAGDSVGGNMSIAVAFMAIERGGPKIDSLIAFYPVTDAAMNTESYQLYAEGPWLTKRAMEWFWDAYAPRVHERSHYMLSPVNAKSDLLKKFPPTLLITDEHDVLRDEGETFAHHLMQAGVIVTSMRMNGTFHDFVMLNSLAHTPAAKAALCAATSFIRKEGIYGQKI